MSHAWANGVLLVNQGRSLLVNDIVYGTTTVYDVHPRTKALRHAQTIVSFISLCGASAISKTSEGYRRCAGQHFSHCEQ